MKHFIRRMNISTPAILIKEEIREEEKRQPTKEEEGVMSGVLFICSSVTDKLSSLFVKELELVDFVKDELVNLQTVLSKIQKVLVDLSSGTDGIGDDETNLVPNWFKLLEDAAYDADDLLDALVTEASMFELLEEVEKKKKKKQLQINVIIKDKMSKIADVIYETGEKLRSKLFPVFRFPASASASQVVFKEEGFLLGRDDDIEAISNRLLLESDNNDGSVPVVAICGMGGIGKTTLARHVFHSERVQNHFDITVWVDVKQELKADFPSIEKILISMNFDNIDKNALEETGIQPQLSGKKKFLIVLDDVWNFNPIQGKLFFSTFQVRGSAGGNKILVTTRNQSVPSIMGGTNPPYNLKLLSDEDCWLLFKQIAFPGSLPPSGSISLIRPEIVQRCGGLPLAAKVLGSLLHSNAGKNEWYDVMRSEVWDLLREDMNSLVLPVLTKTRLSLL